MKEMACYEYYILYNLHDTLLLSLFFTSLSCGQGDQYNECFLSIGCWMYLKPMYSLGKWWKSKISLKSKNSLMGFVYRVVWVLKAQWIFLSETINFWENCIKLTFLGCPPKFYHGVMYIAPSSGHISLNIDMPFKGEVLSRITIISKERVQISLQIGAKMMKIG